MRALTMEEVGYVAGGSNFSEAERDVGQGMQDWSGFVSTLGRIGKAVGPIMNAAGVALVKDADRREGQESPSGGSSGGSGEGGHFGDPGGGGGYSDPRGGGGSGPQVCYGPGDCHSVSVGNG